MLQHSTKAIEARNLIVQALDSVPDNNSWGIVMYIYQKPDGTFEYEFCGSYLEYDEVSKRYKPSKNDFTAGIRKIRSKTRKENAKSKNP